MMMVYDLCVDDGVVGVMKKIVINVDLMLWVMYCV